MVPERIHPISSETLGQETPNLARNFDVLTPQSFLHDFAQRADAATQRVWVQGMYIYPGTCADIIAGSLKDAAGRHLDTRLCVDDYNLIVTDGHANLTYQFNPNKEERVRFNGRRRETAALLAGLIDASVKVHYTNVPKNPIEHVLPVIGRNHNKVVVVDDVAYFGGLNYTDDVLVAADFMVVFEDPTVVGTLSDLFMEDFEEKRIPSDRAIKYGDNSIILTDSGQVSRSLVLDSAIVLGKAAKSKIRFASSYLPDGKLRSVLNDASKESVAVQVVVSPYHTTDKKTWFWLANRATELATDTKQLQFPIRFHDRWVHAKLLIVDNEVAIFGSHNLLAKGVLLGTKERSIATRNRELVENLVQYFEEELLAQSHPSTY